MTTSGVVSTQQLKLQKRRAAYQRRKCRERDLLMAEKECNRKREQRRLEQQRRTVESNKRTRTNGIKLDYTKLIVDFEKKLKGLYNKECKCCKGVSLSFDLDERGHCKDCKDMDTDALITNNLLPIWKDSKGQYHYDVPDVLKQLTLQEKLLIQRAALFIPVQHIKNGTLGVKGHVCCFPQKIDTIYTTLPLLPNQVKYVQLIHKSKDEIGGDVKARKLVIRKQMVLDALKWLKQHNNVYRDIHIEEDNLKWIDGDEADLGTQIESLFDDDDDKGPSTQQVHDIQADQAQNNMASFGVVHEGIPIPSKDDLHINSVLKDIQVKNNIATMSWPDISQIAISEYSHEPLFAMAFPWLFPGGIGDFLQPRAVDEEVAKWGRRLMRFKDARFITDKVFCFYLWNFIMRRRNQAQGNFYVNKLSTSGNLTLDELKEKLLQGNNTFLNEISYYSKKVKGSDGYWRSKRYELLQWVTHHIEMGNGAPSYFGTLSCAEYWWPDIIRLVEERIYIATGVVRKFEAGSSGIVQVMNDYSAVVQEYFQLRVAIWFETIGKHVFSIAHYWLRYEFAPSRGQIHAHFLAIHNDKEIQHDLHANRHSPEHQAKLLSDWAESKIALTAELDYPVFENIDKDK